jgi:hypothetical protein
MLKKFLLSHDFSANEIEHPQQSTIRTITHKTQIPPFIRYSSTFLSFLTLNSLNHTNLTIKWKTFLSFPSRFPHFLGNQTQSTTQTSFKRSIILHSKTNNRQQSDQILTTNPHIKFSQTRQSQHKMETLFFPHFLGNQTK